MLTSKISCLMVVSLAFLLGALLVVPIQGQSWADFQRKHIDSVSAHLPNDPDFYCNNMMRYRGMTTPLCKSHNTFVHAPAQMVQQICQNTLGPAVITSSDSFSFVFCVDTGSYPPPMCNYQGYVMSGQILVTCDYYVPVHFNGFE